MQFHAASLAETGHLVSLIGLSGSEVHSKLLNDPKIEVYSIGNSSSETSPSSLLSSIIRLCIQSLSLAKRLCQLPAYQSILLQNPPAIPSVFVAWIISKCREIGSGASIRLILDWHNLGYSRLALKRGERSWAVQLYRFLESLSVHLVDYHLAVSNALKLRLLDEFKIKDSWVLRDHPPEWFYSNQESHCTKQDLAQLLLEKGITLSTQMPWIVSPTSWTDDENYELLLDAMSLVEARAVKGEVADQRICIIMTGKGAGRERFEQALREKNFTHFQCVTVWLAPEDYPRLLQVADCGLCLHTSSSGVDIPMKLADMLGARLPALTYNYGSCLLESFTPGIHGHLFKDARSLADLLFVILKEPHPQDAMIEDVDICHWEEEWRRVVQHGNLWEVL
jgi:beta-1,4-mannosyltransferase